MFIESALVVGGSTPLGVASVRIRFFYKNLTSSRKSQEKPSICLEQKDLRQNNGGDIFSSANSPYICTSILTKSSYRFIYVRNS